MKNTQIKESESNFPQIELIQAYDADIPHFYANGFISSIGGGDISVVFKLNNSQQATVNLSFTVAKTLAERISMLINKLENASGSKIMNIDTIAKSLSKIENGDEHENGS